jgi:hypothetical protein
VGEWTEVEADTGEVPERLEHVMVRLAPMPAWLRTVVEVVLGDMQLPRPIDVCLAYAGADGSGVLWVWEPDGTGAAGYGVSDTYATHQTDAERLVGFAYWLQDQFFPESDGGWAEARPECPGHAHPAVPEEIDGQGWWVCPNDDRRIAMIGDLAARRRERGA